ncbi:uncharacterized protein EDB91DRAFT_1086772 [Suillus paluster]|uniref:uncharacterized protein n=1 Tax=Suillus paluster TaxID=48578 RepID=UPI001B870A9E|nr:uncharacterized protein EDB91DRAFT_1086772 [Suillus paluster]KAG1726416.1 hypothetical protein EDB91DRAFT_1086772 [Suillus paluster]
MSIFPILDPDYNKPPFPKWLKDIGGGYALLKQQEWRIIQLYLEAYYPQSPEFGYFNDDGSFRVIYWARLRLPNGQTSRSLFATREQQHNARCQIPCIVHPLIIVHPLMTAAGEQVGQNTTMIYSIKVVLVGQQFIQWQHTAIPHPQSQHKSLYLENAELTDVLWQESQILKNNWYDMKCKHNIEVAMLTSRLEQTETLYQQLLKPMDVLAASTTGSGPQDPFLELYCMTKEEWQWEYQNGRGILTVKKSSKSESEQPKMRNQLHAAWHTLLDEDTFTSRHYPQWTSHPKEDNQVKVKREKVDAMNVKVEQVTQDSTSAAVPSTFKQPQSIAISPLVRISKKKKEVHRIPSPPVFSPVPSAAHHDTYLVAEMTQIGAMPDRPTFEHISDKPVGAARDNPVAFEPGALDKPINLTSSDANVQLSQPAIIMNPLKGLFPDQSDSHSADIISVPGPSSITTVHIASTSVGDMDPICNCFVVIDPHVYMPIHACHIWRNSLQFITDIG